jgi:magnesium and cobalt transporter
VLTIDGLRMQVLRADSRRVHTLLVDPQKGLPLLDG